MSKHAIQYTIRGVPEEVDRALRERAEREKVSLNQLVIETLTRQTVGNPPKADFSDVVGKWVPDPEFDRILEEQRQIDWEMWK